MQNDAERLLGLEENEVKSQAREMFLDLIGKNVNTELAKIGLEVINVNIRDITDESGYIGGALETFEEGQRTSGSGWKASCRTRKPS